MGFPGGSVFFSSHFGRDGLEFMLCNRPAYKRACNCDTGDNGDRSYSCQYQEDGLPSLRASLLDDVKRSNPKQTARYCFCAPSIEIEVQNPKRSAVSVEPRRSKSSVVCSGERFYSKARGKLQENHHALNESPRENADS
jgi:hypothetical protein